MGRNILRKKIPSHRFRFRHGFVRSLAAGGDKAGLPPGSFLLGTPEREGFIHPSLQEGRKGTVLPEPAAQNDDEILIRSGFVPGGFETADDGSGQHAFKIDKKRGDGILQG